MAAPRALNPLAQATAAVAWVKEKSRIWPVGPSYSSSRISLRDEAGFFALKGLGKSAQGSSEATPWVYQKREGAPWRGAGKEGEPVAAMLPVPLQGTTQFLMDPGRRCAQPWAGIPMHFQRKRHFSEWLCFW